MTCLRSEANLCLFNNDAHTATSFLLLNFESIATRSFLVEYPDGGDDGWNGY